MDRYENNCINSKHCIQYKIDCTRCQENNKLYFYVKVWMKYQFHKGYHKKLCLSANDHCKFHKHTYLFSCKKSEEFLSEKREL